MKTNINLFILFLLFISLSFSIVNAEKDPDRWIGYLEDSEGNLYYFDLKRMPEPSKNSIRVWHIIETSIGKESRARYEVDCQERRLRLLQWDPHFDYSQEYRKWKKPPPETNEELFLDVVCQTFGY
jgi:hypothetical protein